MSIVDMFKGKKNHLVVGADTDTIKKMKEMANSGKNSTMSFSLAFSYVSKSHASKYSDGLLKLLDLIDSGTCEQILKYADRSNTFFICEDPLIWTSRQFISFSYLKENVKYFNIVENNNHYCLHIIDFNNKEVCMPILIADLESFSESEGLSSVTKFFEDSFGCVA